MLREDMAQWITNLLLLGALIAAIWYAWETRRMRLQMIRPKLVFLTRQHNNSDLGSASVALFVRNVGEGTAINVLLDRITDKGSTLQPEPGRIAVLEKGQEKQLVLHYLAKGNPTDVTRTLDDPSISPRLLARYVDVEGRQFRTSTAVGGGATPPFIEDEQA
jgi:hypothetical protein